MIFIQDFRSPRCQSSSSCWREATFPPRSPDSWTRPPRTRDPAIIIIIINIIIMTIILSSVNTRLWGIFNYIWQVQFEASLSLETIVYDLLIYSTQYLTKMSSWPNPHVIPGVLIVNCDHPQWQHYLTPGAHPAALLTLAHFLQIDSDNDNDHS